MNEELSTNEEWLAARLGKVTSSRIGDMLATTKTGWGASRKNYAAELMSERLLRVPYAHYVSAEMQRGLEMQDTALRAYENRCKMLVSSTENLFISHPRIVMAGCSLDGYVGEDGLVEFKCPNPATHIEMLLGKPIPQRYLYQMQMQMACTGRVWTDFVSFDDRMTVAKSLVIVRVPRADKTIEMIETEIIRFLADIDETMALIEEAYPESSEKLSAA